MVFDIFYSFYTKQKYLCFHSITRVLWPKLGNMNDKTLEFVKDKGTLRSVTLPVRRVVRFWCKLYSLVLSLCTGGFSIIFHFTLFLFLCFSLKLLTVTGCLLQQIAGSGNKTEEQNETPESKAKTPKGRLKKKTSPREPSFSTALTTPIEEVIEETLSEESPGSKSPSKPRRRRNKQKSPEPINDTVGFSFFKSKPSEDLSEEKVYTEQQKLQDSELLQSDPLGFSFIPVRDKKNSKKKYKSEDPQSSIIEHYKPRKPVKREEFVVVNKIEEINSNGKPKENLIEIVNKESGKIVYVEVKESKKVSSKVSYASVASQRSDDTWEQIQSSVSFEEEEKLSIESKEPEYIADNRQLFKSQHFESTNQKEESNEEKLIEELNNLIEESEDQSENFRLRESEEEAEEIVEAIIKNYQKEEEVIEESEDQSEKFRTSESEEEADEIVEAIITNYQNEEKVIEESEDQSEKFLIIESKEEAEAIVEAIIKNYQKEENNEESEDQSEKLKISESRGVVEEIIKKQHAFLLQEVEARAIEESVELAVEASEALKMASGTQIRVLTLNDKEHQDSTLYRIEKNWIIQFRLGPSLFGRKVALYCNYPKEGAKFERNTYYVLEWKQDVGCNHSDDTALLAEITAGISGGFHFYFAYDDGDRQHPQGSGFFLVDPVLKYGKNEDLPLDCIQCQTVLSKNLGPFDTWENKLKVGKESGYNVIHFTPIQELGASNSCYSLSEQLKVNPAFAKQNGEKITFDDVEKLVRKMRNEWKVASICDIVLNHTANESHWLLDHPEVTYNCSNCPHMRPAYLLDAALHQFSVDITKGVYEDKGIPVDVNNEDHLNSIKYHLHADVLSKVKIHELYTCDVEKYVGEFLNLARTTPPGPKTYEEKEELHIVQDPLYRRLSSTVDMKLALKIYNNYRQDCFDEDTRLKKCVENFKNKLDSLNAKISEEINDHLKAAVDNCIAGIRYFRVQPDGPRIKKVDVKNPLVYRYFTDYGFPKSIGEHEEIMYGDKGRFLMAHNGWVMNADPLRNFAAEGSNIYVRRELIAWGDSVKLRYGDKPEDCPFLWNHMRAYVEQTARIFDGVRLDNCHSTPIHVAEYLLDCARSVRPDLYVVAELFTNSDMTDNIFVNRLGITSLIREAMSAWDSHEQGRLVHRYGGVPVGSFYQPRVRPLVPTIAHALFLDLTHDNPSPIEKRSVFDFLPSSALVNMACCASGSNRGYDELVPHHIHVVDETRQYTEWTDDEKQSLGNPRYVTRKSGIVAAKKALNELHYRLGKGGFSQVYVDQMDPDVVAVTRHDPETHQSYVLVAFTAFGHPAEDAASYQRSIRPLRVEGVLDEIVLEAALDHVSTKSAGSKYRKFENFTKDAKYINGLSEYQITLKEHIQPSQSEFFEKVDSGTPNIFQLNFRNFKPGSIAVFKVSLQEDMNEAVKNMRQLINQFSFKKDTDLWRIISEMLLPDLNRALYRCDQEERDEGYGFATYDIPNYGRLVYAGLQGFMSLLSTIRPNNDLGHPMCGNLRDGNWMIDYVWQRLKLDDGTKPLGQWIEENTKSLKLLPRYLVPCYFDVLVTGIYVVLVEHSHSIMADFVKNGSSFVKGLAMGSLQFAAYIKSADLPRLSPNVVDPKPPHRKNENKETVQACVSLSAGLPHFSVGYMRNWGRDTFIALRGLFILTGRYDDARYHILGYAACLRHGLIPNLLDGGRNPRFNCRDAIWWWLHCIKCYAEDAPGGLAILTDRVSRIFPEDDSSPQPPGAVDQPLHDVMQEALKVHFQGLVFRERNAGRQIDEHMTDRGFNNQIGIHPETGFVFGGNSANCGTWMDKMGSSEKAGIRGKPATPRDGSAVELVGLSKSVVLWLHKTNETGKYPYGGVERTHKDGHVTRWTFKEWADKIQENFEKSFWVNTTPTSDEIRPDLINKRGIYKDCVGASQDWTDYQLRCNFPISMVVAPELFDPKHAWVALDRAEKYLLGPLGMKTLDPEDWAYNGDYDNSNDSDNPKLANGFNYHQGPEWVWPVGFYLRARLQFAAANGQLRKTLADTKTVLSRHFTELQTSDWRGLPELTNSDGAYCRDSSRTQAWSMACILEVLHDLRNAEKRHISSN